MINAQAKFDIQLRNVKAKCKQHEMDNDAIRRKNAFLIADKEHLDNKIQEYLMEIKECNESYHDLEMTNHELKKNNRQLVSQLETVKSKNEELLDKIFNSRKKLVATQVLHELQIS